MLPNQIRPTRLHQRSLKAHYRIDPISEPPQQLLVCMCAEVQTPSIGQVVSLTLRRYIGDIEMIAQFFHALVFDDGVLVADVGDHEKILGGRLWPVPV